MALSAKVMAELVFRCALTEAMESQKHTYDPDKNPREIIWCRRASGGATNIFSLSGWIRRGVWWSSPNLDMGGLVTDLPFFVWYNFGKREVDMERFDVFQWANEVDEVKNNVSVELFLFNKNYTPYKVRYSDALTQSVKSMFMLEAVQYVIKEADKGLAFREYETNDGDDKVVYRVDLSKVGRAETLVHLVENEYKDIEYFTDNEHEFKRVRGILAKFSYPGESGQKVFYIAKGLAAGSALRGKTSWELMGESFEPLSADVAIKMPENNEVAIVDGNIVIFNQGKFEKLFQYDYKSQVISEEKARELMEAYGLSFPEGLSLDALLQDKKPLIKKLEGITVGEMKQEQVVDYADEMKLELMTDEAGKIIIMDQKDLGTFVNLLNEDYFVSPVNGRRYEIKSKKLLDEPEGEPPRG